MSESRASHLVQLKMSSPSMRAAALAFALSSWVEGLTQLRAVLLMPSLPRDPEEDFHEPQPLSSSASWRDRIVAWLKRSGRRDTQMDDTERTSLGIIDIATAFLILQMLRQPLLPFLLSPFLTTLPLPRSTSAFKPIKWPHLVFSTFLLSLLHEAERVSVFLAVDSIKKRRDSKNRTLLGDVYVRGGELRPSVDEDEEEECLICAGAGADTSLSQSISSLSSMTTSVPLDVLGPLEAFCATAPQKHVAHRSCFLSWHAAYRQQRMHLSPEIVELELQHTVPTEATRQRAQAIMEAAGFSYLSRFIRFPHEQPRRRMQLLPSESQPIIRPTLTLTEHVAGPSLNMAPSSIATLHTTTPPCPGCRSSVFLHFFSRPLAPSHEEERGRGRGRQDVLAAFVRLWIHHWCKLVTGRTILYRLASQWSFVMALLSMIRVSGNSSQWRT